MKELIFKRKAYDKLLHWKQEANGKTALLIEGARRIGKSTLVEQFAKTEYKSYILIDFANVSPEINDLIENHISNLDYFFMHLHPHRHRGIHARSQPPSHQVSGLRHSRRHDFRRSAVIRCSASHLQTVEQETLT